MVRAVVTNLLMRIDALRSEILEGYALVIGLLFISRTPDLLISEPYSWEPC